MLILIAESKTMSPCEDAMGTDELDRHRPALEESAADVMRRLGEEDADTLAAMTRLSLPMVRRLQKMIYEFPNKATGGKAIEAYTGVVFKAFDYPSLTDDEKDEACRRVRIVSSLYGWLRPDDIVKPYRLDFTSPVGPGGMSLAAFQRKAVTECLVKELADTTVNDILDLMPGDAARCLDMKEVKKRARVWKLDFKEVMPGGAMRTPNAGRLKTLRGMLLRRIIRDRIASAEELMHISADEFAAYPDQSADGVITFIC